MKRTTSALITWIQSLLGRQLGRNTAFSLLQALIGMVCMFGSYKVLVAEVGIEKLGLWSLLLAGSMLARFADVSGAGGLARFVAERQSEKDRDGVVFFIHTVLLTTILFNLVAASLLYLLSDILIEHFVEARWISEARTLVPIAIITTTVLPAMATTLCSAIDGTQRADQRAVVVSVSSMVLLAATVLFVSEFGVLGFGFAQLTQQVFLIVVAWLVLRCHVSNLGWFPQQWSQVVFRQSVNFGLKIQANALAALLSDPLAKFMLAHWSGVAMVGYYEFAARLVLQLRGLLVASAQPLMAAAAGVSKEGQSTHRLLLSSTRLAVFAGCGMAIISILSAPWFSQIMVGEIRKEIVMIVAALALGYGINMFSVPLYFAAMGHGIVRWNFLSQACMAISIISASALLGPRFGSVGIVLGIMTGLIGGSALVGFGNAHVLGMMDVVRRLRWELLAASLAIAAMSAAAMGIFVVAVR